ncbi:MAG TPA: hypothetical protein VJB02_01250 [Coxiellaceae bacterium]|nr:hypothetical protein [Coxiellaceae bacterium]
MKMTQWIIRLMAGVALSVLLVFHVSAWADSLPCTDDHNVCHKAERYSTDAVQKNRAEIRHRYRHDPKEVLVEAPPTLTGDWNFHYFA